MGLAGALSRLGFGLVLLVIMYTIAPIISMLMVVYFVIDVILIAVGRDGLDSLGFVQRLYEWYFGNTVFVVFGEGSWQWMP